MPPKTRSAQVAKKPSRAARKKAGGGARRLLGLLFFIVGGLSATAVLLYLDGQHPFTKNRWAAAAPVKSLPVSLLRVRTPAEMRDMEPLSLNRPILIRIFDDSEMGGPDDPKHPANAAFIRLATEVWQGTSGLADDPLNWTNILFAEFDAGQHPVFAVADMQLAYQLPAVMLLVNGAAATHVNTVPRGAEGVKLLREMVAAHPIKQA